MSKDSLRTKMPANYGKSSCPQIALALGAGGARARRIMLSVREKEHEGYGSGCFPLLESLQPGEISFPMIRDLRENMNRFLRGVGGTNNRSGATIMLAIENPAEAGKETPPQHTWPPLSDNSPVLGDEDDMIDLDEMELDDSLMGQTDQLESVLARLRQEDEAAVSSRNATRDGNLPKTPSPRRSRRSRSPNDDQPDKRAKPRFEGEFLNTMSGMFKQMTDTFKFQQEERDQWRKANSTK